jgi:hypothetical protein
MRVWRGSRLALAGGRRGRIMTREVSVLAGTLAARLAELFVSDSEIVVRLSDAQRRLLGANDRLWSGLGSDALGVFYGDARRVVVGGESAIAAGMIDALRAGDGSRELEAAVLEALARAHWAIHRAFCEYQSACEERRQLAVDVGELSGQLIKELCAAGWSVQAARRADVNELAGAAALGDWRGER